MTLLCFFSPSEREVETMESCAEMEGLSACSVSRTLLPDHLDEGGNRGSPIRGTDSPSKRKGMSSLSGHMKDFVIPTARINNI